MSDFRLHRRLLGLAGVVAVLMAAGCGEAQVAAGPSIGDPIPDLPLRGIGPAKGSIAELRGRVVVLNVWAPWCPPCLKEMPSLERLSRQLDSARFAVVGVTVDDQFLAEEFLRRHGITFPNHIGERDALERRLGVRAYPETLLIDADGLIAERVVGSREWDAARIVEQLERIAASGAGSEGAKAADGG